MNRICLAIFLMCSCAALPQTAKYRHDGPIYLNDVHNTPGAVYNVSVQQVCKPGYSKTVRHVPLSVKKQVCNLYGVPPAHCNGKEIEIDHLISLEIGGSNDINNLWPEPYMPIPGAREKDKLENWLHRQVCSGNMALPTAQKGISGDWYEGYVRFVQSAH